MYKFFNNQGRILKKWKANWSSTLRLAWSLWHWLSLFILNLLGYLTKNTQLSPFQWKQSEWQNTEQLGTNQNARSVDKLRARCGSQEANDELKKKTKKYWRSCKKCDWVRWFWMGYHFLISKFLGFTDNIFCALFFVLKWTLSTMEDNPRHISPELRRVSSSPFCKPILKVFRFLWNVERVGYFFRVRNASPLRYHRGNKSKIPEDLICN